MSLVIYYIMLLRFFWFHFSFGLLCIQLDTKNTRVQFYRHRGRSCMMLISRLLHKKHAMAFLVELAGSVEKWPRRIP